MFEIIQQSAVLIGVFALLGGALWFVKKRPRANFRFGTPRRMEVIERVALTPNHFLCLVKMEDRLMMIGTAPSSCQLIEMLEGPGK